MQKSCRSSSGPTLFRNSVLKYLLSCLRLVGEVDREGGRGLMREGKRGGGEGGGWRKGEG